MTLVKICGLKSPEDVKAARAADMNGFVVECGTRRSVTVERARDLMALSPLPKIVVSTSPSADRLIYYADALRPHALQVASPLPADDLRKVVDEAGCDVWGVVHIGAGGEPERAREIAPLVDAVLLDTSSPQGGGSGVTHDFNISAAITRSLSKPAVLAGGLNAANVADAVRAVRPWAVDVSSGAERDGRKHAGEVGAIIEAVRRFT